MLQADFSLVNGSFETVAIAGIVQCSWTVKTVDRR
jgi:hypothetical protein